MVAAGEPKLTSGVQKHPSDMSPLSFACVPAGFVCSEHVVDEQGLSSPLS